MTARRCWLGNSVASSSRTVFAAGSRQRHLDLGADTPCLAGDRFDDFGVHLGLGIEAVDVAVPGLEGGDAEVELAQVAVVAGDVHHHSLAHRVAEAGTAGDLEDHASAGRGDARAVVAARQIDVVDGAMRNDEVAKRRRDLRRRRRRKQRGHKEKAEIR